MNRHDSLSVLSNRGHHILSTHVNGWTYRKFEKGEIGVSKTFCFKSVPESAFGQDVKKYVELLPLWSEVINKVSELLGEPITKLARDTRELYVDIDELNVENAKLFTKDGKLKKNSKRANDLRKGYLEALDAVGLKDFMDIHFIKFAYGTMRTSHVQSLESFISSEKEIYFKANFDMIGREKSSGYIVPITEIQFEEKYLAELKDREAKP